MTIVGHCHCRRVRIEAPAAPEWIGECDCTICTRLGWLTAYYPDGAVRVAGETVPYVQGDRMLDQHHCGVCGCATHWRPRVEGIDRMGVNARLFDGFRIGETVGAAPTLDGRPVEVRRLRNR